jgi:hypothetical protein
MKIMKKTLTLMAMAILGSAFAQTNVTFQVDMNNFTGTFTAPEVNGTFNSWCGNCAAMTDADSNNVWEVNIALTAGDTVEYKYSHDAWTGQETNDPTAACTNGNTTNTNRVLVVPAAATTLPVVCWGSCGPCTSPVDVTFQVDMQLYTTSFTAPEVNGTFNSWCGNCAAMTDADGDNVWDVTISLNAGDTVEYKYSHDNWTGQETNDPTAACTNGNTTYTNRVLVVPAASDTLDVVCWASCDACSGVSLDEEAAIMTLSPNPANEGLNVDFAGTQGNYAIMTLNGQVVASGTLVHGQNDVTTAALPNGVYIVRVASEQGQTMQKLAIRH